MADPNVTIHEGKVFSCDIRPGRRSAPAAELFQNMVAQQDQPDVEFASLHSNSWLEEVYNG